MSNLASRLLVALLGIPLLLAATVIGGVWLSTLVILLQLLAFFEWKKIGATVGANIFLPSSIISVLAIDLLIIGYGNPRSAAIGLIAIGIWLCIEVFRDDRQPLKNLAVGGLFLLYVCLPLVLWTHFATFNDPLRFSKMGPLAILFMATWLCDSGAYFGGRALGKYKLYPAASPNKTVEGAIAGVIFSALLLPIMLLANWARPTFADMIMLPVCVGIFGQTGDLLESLIKREAQVKDASALLPGHGGILDRFDSLLISTLFFFAYLLISTN